MLNPQQYDEAMHRALVLAENGPAWGVNPQVGAVILDAKNRIIGEGWHKGSGTPHAEVMALRDATQRGVSVQGATAYVTLEPCNHFGRTPPCSRALVDAGVNRVRWAAAGCSAPCSSELGWPGLVWPTQATQRAEPCMR